MTLASRLLGALAAAFSLALLSPTAQAVPAYARQAGMTCSGCHIGAFGPQLTPAGIKFKLGGYTDSDGQGTKVPLSAMLRASYTHTKDDANPPAAHLKANDNLKLDQASVFLAGRVTDLLGTFVQVSHNGVEHSTALDKVDVRLATTIDTGERETIAGLSFNNAPGVQDAFNTLPMWDFPYEWVQASPGMGSARTQLDGALARRVLGASAYALLNDRYYAELGTYRSLSPSFQGKLGLEDDHPERLGGNAYWRLAYYMDQKRTAFSAGLFGFRGRIEADRNVPAPRDRFDDVGVDGSYQFLGTREHAVTLNGSAIREHRTDGLSGAKATLRTTRLNASYHHQQTWGASIGLFNTRGNAPTDGTRGTLLQADWTPWGKEDALAPGGANLRLGAQYTLYDKYDGVSAGASGKNTFTLFVWTSL